MAFSWPFVSVVIPHYNDAEALERVVAAVRAQDYAGEVEIVVADDGSAEPPEIEGVRVVRQEDKGFRAAAARNLGADAARGEIAEIGHVLRRAAEHDRQGRGSGDGVELIARGDAGEEQPVHAAGFIGPGTRDRVVE